MSENSKLRSLKLDSLEFYKGRKKKKSKKVSGSFFNCVKEDHDHTAKLNKLLEQSDGSAV